MGVSTRLTKAEGRKFAFTVGIAFLVLAALSAWRGHTWPPRVMGAVGGTLILAGLLVPARLGGVQRAWMGLAHLISKVTAPIVIGVMYFLLITPVAGLMRLFGRNPLHNRVHDGGYWVPPTSGGRSNLHNQF